MSKLKFAVLGTGFWSHYQIPAWFEVGGVELVAVYNRTVSKAEKVAEKFGVPRVYGDPEELLQKEELDFIDIITEVPAHAPLVYLAAKYKVPVICQKPMAPDYETARKMVDTCRQAGIPFFVHENYRWQTPVRTAKKLLDQGHLGRPFRGRFQCGPIPGDAIHQLDLARFFFGEAHSIYCQHLRTRGDIQGEDVASITLKMENAICNVEMSFVSKTEWGHFPEELIYIEGTKGTLELAPDFWIRVTTAEGTWSRRYLPPRYPWADPNYDVNHASMVPLHQDLLRAFRTGEPPENTGEDNLKTMQLVYAAYESAAKNQVIEIK